MSHLLKNKNICLLYVYSFLSTFLLFRACDTLYYLSKGVNSSKYILFTVVSASLVVLFQIPAGMLGDKINKKYILLISNLLLLISIIFYIISNSFWGLVVGIVLHTLFNLFTNGIVNSIIYEVTKNKKDFSKAIFLKAIFSYSGYGIAMVLGGIVADINLVYMYYISLFPVLLNFIVLLGLDNIKSTNSEKQTFKTIIKSAKELLKDNKLLRYIIIYEGILMSIITILAEAHPEYSAHLGVSGMVIGIYTALMLVFGIFGEYICTKINSDLIKIVIVPIITGIVIILVGLLNNVLGIIFIVLAQFVYDIQYNGMLSILHDNAIDNSRVTLEGILSLVSSFFGIIFGVFTSIILKYISVAESFIIVGFILIICILLLVIKYRKNIFNELWRF